MDGYEMFRSQRQMKAINVGTGVEGLMKLVGSREQWEIHERVAPARGTA